MNDMLHDENANYMNKKNLLFWGSFSSLDFR